MKIDAEQTQNYISMKAKKTLTFLFIAFASGIFALTSMAQVDKPAPVTSTSVPASLDFTKAAGISVPAVVHIKTESKQKNSSYDDFYGGIWDQWGYYNNPDYSSTVKASGSGVILTEDGYIVTNNHVVEDAETIMVTLNDNRTYEATTVGTDEGTDLALIKIEEKGLPFLSYGNSDSVKVGEWVLAVGNPFNLTSTVTAGIISAKARNLNILGANSSIESFLQTDAAVNPGNSGGALVNTKGELVGINAAIASTTGSYLGYSFAIPANIVKKVVGDFMQYGIVQRGYLGITFEEIDAEVAKEKSLSKVQGIYVTSVAEGSAAEDVDLKVGDIITKIGTADIRSGSELLEAVVIHSPGDKVKVTYLRDDVEKEVSVTMKNINNSTELAVKDESLPVDILGATFDKLTDKEIKELGIKNGLKITKIETGILKNSGVRIGFIVTTIDKKEVTKADDLNSLKENKKGSVMVEGIYENGMHASYRIGK
jgi:serine protease Do